MKFRFFKNLLQFPTVEKCIGCIAYWYLKFVGKTTRWKVDGMERAYKTLGEHGSMVVVGWHGRTLELPYFWNKSRELNALVSPHRDGRMIVYILQKFGIGHISGSSDKNPREAALELMRNLQQGNSIAIIPDGPRGPSMKMSMSPIFYAQKSGKPLIGITYSIRGSKVFSKSWDCMLLPFPFHKGRYVFTEPMFIPEDATPEQLEEYRLKLENELNEVTWKIDKEMGIPYIPQGKLPKKSRKQIKLEKEGK